MNFNKVKSIILFSFALFCSQTIIAQNYTLNGDGTALGNDCYELTTEVDFQLSTIWYNDQIDLTESFDIEFIINLGANDAGADGIVFVLQTVGVNAVGLSGGGIGFEGFAPSFGVEFDTWQNGDFADLVEDHVAIMQNGDPNHNTNNTLSGPVPMLPGGANAEDGLDHVIRIEWNADTQSMDVYVDCILTISLDNYDLVTEIFGGDPNVWFGFTAATGGATNIQTVCLSPNILEVSEDQTICVGDTVQLLAGGSVDGTYEWTPSESLSADDIPNPVAMPMTTTEYFVTFNNLCGFAIEDTIVVTVESCFACEPLSGVAESASPICTDDELTASSTGFNADADYEQTYLLILDNEILAITSDGDFGIQALGEYEVYPLNYATVDAPDLDIIGLDLSELTNQTACFELGEAAIVIVETCFICEAVGGSAESVSPLCSVDAITATSTGFNTDADYDQTHLLVDDNTIVAIAADGEFGVQASATYEVYPLNYSTIEIPDLDIIGLDLSDLTSQTACFELGTAATVTVLAPIDIAVDYFCDGLTGTYSLTFGLSGGLPEFDNASPYNASGDLNGEFFISDNNQTLVFIDVTPYQLSLVDDLGCEASVGDQPAACIKTAIDLLTFDGKTLTEGNQLIWETAAEADGDFFVLEKSVDGTSFSPIKTIVGSGFANTTQNYSFLDRDITTPNSYYRLLTFEEGEVLTQISDVVLLKRAQATNLELQNWNLTSDLTLSLNSPLNSIIDIQLYDMNGKIVFASTQAIGEGNNLLVLPMNEMVSGLYLLSIENEMQQISQLLVKH